MRCTYCTYKTSPRTLGPRDMFVCTSALPPSDPGVGLRQCVGLGFVCTYDEPPVLRPSDPGVRLRQCEPQSAGDGRRRRDGVPQ